MTHNASLPVEDNCVIMHNEKIELVYEEEPVYIYKLIKQSVKEDVEFCEGRLVGKLDSASNNKVWWCRNKRCYNACQVQRTSDMWQKYTLADMIINLGLPFNEEGYFKFIGVLNRVEQLKEHLRCKKCSFILRPTKQSNFSFYRANLFCCTNPSCDEQGKNIYLSSCSNHKCLTVIDSRESVRCNKCGGCCSKYQLDQRQGVIMQNLTQEQQNNDPTLMSIRYNLDKELYHLENMEFQCYICNAIMVPRYGPGTTLYCKKHFVQYPSEYLPELRTISTKSPAKKEG